MSSPKTKSPHRKTTTKSKSQPTGLYGKSKALLNKTLDHQRARAQRGIKQVRAIGANILEDISKRLGEASRRVNELAKKTR